MSVRQLLDLQGRTAIVTGGSRGLGLQIAEGLGEMGAKLALTARKKDELDEAVRHLGTMGIEAHAWVCDVGRRETIPGVFDQILAKLGRLDILVNNAGAVWGAPAEDHPLEAWDKLVGLNLVGGFVMAQQAAKKAMIPAKWGRIIFVASVAGLTASDPAVVRTVSYNATKHAVVGMAKQLAAEWGEHGITVNAICPGFFPSKMTRATLDTTGELVRKVTPTRRLGGPEDLKGLAVLLASEASRHITGQAIAVDGGAMLI
ncbi:MAG: gluconate 5-dehydrogenase [Betaproteobacteria bacterium RIFCSPLOWO2_02_FULL_67_19]|nr:MAG: gluconate 5-dehydrogenase [Betaproteobacteria bacterium RIFCSPLOWO2_02_FULL_67_19]